MKKNNRGRACHKRGAAIMTVIIFFVTLTSAMAIALSSPVVREYVTARDFEKSKGAYYLSESGSEDAIYRVTKGKQIDSQEILSLGGNTATTTITTVNANNRTIGSIGDISRNTRRVKSTLTTAVGASFNYGVQVGSGGVYLQNTSRITGNLYSAGPVCGGNGSGSTCSGATGTNTITGVVISGGSTGSNGVIGNITNQTGSSMYAGTIKNSVIAGTPYCNTISGSTPNTCQALAPQPAAPFPLSATDIANLEATAQAGGVNNCNGEDKIIISTSTTIGPKKYTCDIFIQGVGTVVTLQGPVWAVGNIDIKNAVIVRVDPTLSGQSIAMIADKASNRTESSMVVIEDNNPTFTGAPGGNSWVMFISENTSISTGGTLNAISLENGASGDLILFARLGGIILKNNSSVSAVTGYKLTLRNTANVVYSSGLPNALFNTGPTGTWTLQSWKEGQ